MSRATDCFSIYSVISSRIMASRLPYNSSAMVRHSSVLPTPVGPVKSIQAMGRSGSRTPAKPRRSNSATVFTASL